MGFRLNSDAHQDQDDYLSLARILPVVDVCNKATLFRARRTIVRVLKERNARDVLDVCCGTGCLSRQLVAAGFDLVVGVDSSPTMLTRARKRVPMAEMLDVDAARLPFCDEFDAAVISLALHEMDPELREAVWKRMRVALRPTGVLIALDFAVPSAAGLWSRLVRFFIEKDERNFAKSNPALYRNYRQFIEAGGILKWIEKRESRIETSHSFLGGCIGVIAVPA